MEQRYDREQRDRRAGRGRASHPQGYGYGQDAEGRGARRAAGGFGFDERRPGERANPPDGWSQRRDDDRGYGAVRGYDPGDYGASSRDERSGRGFAPEGDEDLGVFGGYGGYDAHAGYGGEDDTPGYGREEQRRYSESRGAPYRDRPRGERYDDDLRSGSIAAREREQRRWRGDAGRFGGREETSWPQSRGEHAGRGPREYQRSDERIREDACDRLTDAGEVDASNVTVSVSNGEVTIEGEVPSRQMKRAAEDCLEDISGVKQIHNHLRVTQNGHHRSTTLL
jgi:hypothetical protein